MPAKKKKTSRHQIRKSSLTSQGRFANRIVKAMANWKDFKNWLEKKVVVANIETKYPREFQKL